MGTESTESRIDSVWLSVGARPNFEAEKPWGLMEKKKVKARVKVP